MSQRLVKLRAFLVIATLAALAACQAPPPAPPPPAPPIVYAPRAPLPPFNASSSSYIPPVRPDGLRQTINRDIGPLETLWHLRAALNVAALSCPANLYPTMVDDYNNFIGTNAKVLTNANNAIIRKFQRDIGAGYKIEHDRHQTMLYNHFSFSPLRRPFCDQAMQVGQRVVLVKGDQLDEFASGALLELEKPFDDFYLAFEQYRRDLQAWRAVYAPEQLPAADVLPVENVTNATVPSPGGN